MIRRRVLTFGVVALAASALLGGCAASGIDPLEQAETTFDALVAEASALDATVLRTVEVGERTEQACGDDPAVVTTGLVATATVPVEASGLAIGQIADGLFATLDPLVWLPIRTTDGVDQLAVRNDDGIVATLTTESRSLVIAVFTPCATAG